MINKIVRKYLKNFRFYWKVLFSEIPIFSKNFVYYFKELINICKSFSTFIIQEYPKLKLNQISKKFNGIIYIFDFKNYSRMRELYLGLYQTKIVSVLLKYLNKGDIFIDVGAHIGYISAIGSGLVGKKGQVHSFEPVPIYFKKLLELSRLNKNHQIFVNNFALGETEETSNIDLNKEVKGWNTMVRGLMNPNEIENTIKVRVISLSDYIFEMNIERISLIKIDVEGFEFPVLKGLTSYFESNKEKLPPIIIEIAPSAYPLLGYKIEDLDMFMKKYSYNAISLDERKRIDIRHLVNTTDVLFKQKVKSS